MTTRRNFMKIALLGAVAATGKTFAASDAIDTLPQALEALKSISKSGNIGEYVASIGQLFLGKPYIGGTLDENESEELTYTFDGFDCVTFCETVISLAHLAQLGEYTIPAFERELTKIRYRGGILNDYSSRSHYTSEWIRSNEDLGIIKDLSQELGGILFSSKLNFMSTHPNFYSALKNSPEMVKKIVANENRINACKRFYIPKAEFGKIERDISSGDMIAIVTGKAGLDYSHVGLALRKSNGKLHFMHASSAKKCVIIDSTLAEYLERNTSSLGISVLRPL